MQIQGVQKLQTDENQQAAQQPDSPSLHIITTTAANEELPFDVEEEPARERQKSAWTVTAYYWCRVCKKKTPVKDAKSCDCGVTMCNVCWAEWDFICPICESDMSG